MIYFLFSKRYLLLIAKIFVVILLAVVLCVTWIFLFPTDLDDYSLNTNVPPIDESNGQDVIVERTEIWKPSAINIAKIKSKGCVADGILSGYNKPELDIPLVQESNCHYFHRALETWLEPPDIPRAKKIIEEIDRDDVQYGMFIAEAIDTKANYTFRAQGRKFDFSEMCRSKSKNFWGEHTCKPSFKKQEYSDYVRQITRDAMDIGVRVFLFGQIPHQEENYRFPRVDNIIREMRAYAQMQGFDILIGGQTGEINNKKYLRNFDFIDGGVGLLPDGSIEEGPCFSLYQAVDPHWCWPLMWHSDYKDRVDHVFTYLDWNGQVNDEMHIFTSMGTDLRHKTLRYLYRELPRRGVAYFLPVITPLPRDGGDNCHGPRAKFYTPHMYYECKDIDIINDILAP